MRHPEAHARRLTGQTIAAIITTTALALSAAACGSTTKHPSVAARAGSAQAHTAVGFAQCMRSHGVPRFPDPQSASTAKFPAAQQLGVSTPQFETAQKDCQHLLPAGTDDEFPRTEVRVLLIGMLRFSQCMRSHGIAEWPDPTVDSQGQPGFNLIDLPNINADSPQATRAENSCQRLLPSALGGIPVSQP
jgi:hypothetical protein